jgi:hypothetical protein
MTHNDHTPGPWHACRVTPNGTVHVRDDSNNVPAIAVCLDARGRREANARLIAAAPELLSALQRVKDATPQERPWLLADAFAVVEKVTGGAA